MRKDNQGDSASSCQSASDEEDSASCDTVPGEKTGDGKNLYVKRVISADPDYELVSEMPSGDDKVDKSGSCQKCHKPMPQWAEVKRRSSDPQQQRHPSASDSNSSSAAKTEQQLGLIRQMLEQQKKETLPRTAEVAVGAAAVAAANNPPLKNQAVDKNKFDFSGPPEYRSKKKDITVPDKSVVPVVDRQFQNDAVNKNLEDKPCQSFKMRSFQCVENSTRRLLWKLGDHLTKAPVLMLLIPLFICCLSTVGVIVRRQNLTLGTPFRSYYSSASSIESQGSIFNDSNLRYDALQRMSGSDFAVLFKARNGGNVLQEEIVDAYLTLKQAVENIKVVGQGKVYKYSTLCRHSQETCEMDVVQAIMNSGRNLKFRFPEMEIPRPGKNSSATVFLGETFGGVETDEDGSVARARTLAMYFKLKTKTSRDDVSADDALSMASLVEQWDRQFQRVVLERDGKIKEASLSWWSYDAFSKAVVETFRSIYVYLAVSLAVLGVGCLGVCFAVHGLDCKSWSFTGLIGIAMLFFTVGSAISVDVGITGYLNPATFPAYFMLAASCIFFVINMMQSWHKYNNIIINPAEKLRFILSWEFSAVVLICITVTISYAIAAVASGTALFKSVCQLMAVGFVFLLLLLLFFYNCLLYLFGRREATLKEWFQKDEKQAASFSTPILKRYNLRDMEILHRKYLDTSPHVIARKIGLPLSSVYMRYVALLVFCIYLIFAAWGCSLAPIDLNERQYVRPSIDVDVDMFLNDYDQYYSRYDNYIELVFGNPIDYYSPKVRAAVNDILNWVEYEQHLSDKVVSWLRDFAEFEKGSIYLVNRDTFVPVVDLIFLRDERYKRYSTDLALGKYNEQILGSRMYIELNRFGMNRRLEIIKFINAKAKESNLPMTVKAPNVFLLQHDVEIQTEIVSVLAVAICISVIVTLIAFAQPALTVIVLICIISTTVGTIGFAALWNVPVNAVNEATVLAGLSYTLVLCTTCCHFFNNVQLSTAKDRLLYSCQSIAYGSLSAGFLTVLSFLPLLIVDCQLIVHQAKIVFLHFAFSTLHCCLFLPPCLILCGTSVPTFCRAVKEMCRESCCCCDADEDATSIYYLPTGGRSIDPLYVQQFFRLKFREDISPTPQPALPPPPRREMITAPPPPPPHTGDTAARRLKRSDVVAMEVAAANGRGRNYVERSRRSSFETEDSQQPPPSLVHRRYSDEFAKHDDHQSRAARRRRRRRSLSPETKRHTNAADANAEKIETKPRRPPRKKLSRSTSPGLSSTKNSVDDLCYEEPSDPENTTTGDLRRQRSHRQSYRSRTKSLEGSLIESVEDDSIAEVAEFDDLPNDPKSKNKISYAKWTKETPLNSYTTERVTAEKYTIELPPDWKRFWLKGDLRKATESSGADGNLIGMVPTNDHYRPMHVRSDAHPAARFAYGHHQSGPYVVASPEFYPMDARKPPRMYPARGYGQSFVHPASPTVHQFVQRPMQPSNSYRQPAYW